MGRIGAPHGVRGAFRVRPESADPASLLGYGEWLLRQREGAWVAHRVRDARAHAGGLVAQLEGIESRDAAGALRGAEIGVPRDALPPLGQDEHYQADLVGLAVVNREGAALGTLRGFVESGAHPIARIVDGAGRERLVPWVPPHVDRVDVAAGRIDVDWPADA